MRDVAVIGIGQTPVGEHWDQSLRMLAAEAIEHARKDADVKSVDALYVGNAFGPTFSSQSHLGTLIADYAGLPGVEAYAVEAAGASGGVALRTGYMAVASGLVDTAVVVGVEKSSDKIGSGRVEARSVSLDADYEAIHGATLPALAGLLMRRYMHEYGVDMDAFEGFSINAHANGRANPNSMFKNAVRPGSFARAPMVSDPVNLFDGAPDADGAAAVVLVAADRAPDMVSKPVMIGGSAVATDTLTLQDRGDLLRLEAVALSTVKACQQAGLTAQDADFFELHDEFTILSVLALEAAGFAKRGKGWKLAKDSGQLIGLGGQLPISTFGGLKSRGNPAGAAGVYQAVEAVLQLRGDAGDNQVTASKTALIQNLGGIGSTAVTHVLTV
jgi:acetyl-CoA C-acetyltransferase